MLSLRSLNQKTLKIFALSLAIIISACSSTPVMDDVNKIKRGMLKDEVIELAGSPQKRRRWKGQDQWTYVYFVNNERTGTDVHFEYGKVVHIGKAKFQPDLQDQIEDASTYKEYKAKVREKAKKKDEGFKPVQ